jgi:hypothetical protein
MDRKSIATTRHAGSEIVPVDHQTKIRAGSRHGFSWRLRTDLTRRGACRIYLRFFVRCLRERDFAGRLRRWIAPVLGTIAPCDRGDRPLKQRDSSYPSRHAVSRDADSSSERPDARISAAPGSETHRCIILI